MVNVLLSTAVNFGFELVRIDVSQAFMQADRVHPEERLVVILPKWIPIPWTNKIFCPEEESTAPPATHGLITIRPLYGGRDAPLRWFLRLSTVLRKHGWAQLRSDVCLFTRRSYKNRLVGLLVVQVGDILCTANPSALKEFSEIMKTFKQESLEP